MNASGKTITLAPLPAAFPIKRVALSTQASVSKGTAPACTTATFTLVFLKVKIDAPPFCDERQCRQQAGLRLGGGRHRMWRQAASLPNLLGRTLRCVPSLAA